jgi:hypothetical protein
LVRNPQYLSKKSKAEFAGPALTSLDIADLSFREPNEFRELKLTQVSLETEHLYANSEVSLNALHAEKVWLNL